MNSPKRVQTCKVAPVGSLELSEHIRTTPQHLFSRGQTDRSASSQYSRLATDRSLEFNRSMRHRPSLPPIAEIRLRRGNCVDQCRKKVLANLLSEKCQSPKSNSQESMKKINLRQKTLVNLEQFKMNAIEKYLFRMENIRLAQKLLFVKPTPQVSQQNLKKFYLRQKQLKKHISKPSMALPVKNARSNGKPARKWIE